VNARVVGATLITIVLTLLISVIGAGLLEIADGRDFVGAFFDGGPRLLIGTLWVTVPVWGILLLVCNVRNRHRGGSWVLSANVLMTLAISALTIVAWFVVALVMGGWALFLVAISLVSCVIFVSAASVSLSITHLWVFRRPLAPVTLKLVQSRVLLPSSDQA
jgi:hypothetical protein